jgi:hypothetical protein
VGATNVISIHGTVADQRLRRSEANGGDWRAEEDGGEE